VTDSTDAGPLAGSRVLELGSTIAGPFCARLFADFGADIVKVEPREGDTVRTMGAHRDGVSLYAASILRNKRLICVDMKSARGQTMVRDLAAASDAVIENFRPGTLEKWGLGYDDLSRANPRIVLIRISGYGQTGPYRERPGYGVIGEAVGGLREMTGDPDRPPARVGVALTDCIAALYAAFGGAMALMEAGRTGRGQCVDVALYESAFSFMEPHVPAFAALGIVPKRAGSSLPLHAPNNLYPTGDDRYIHIAAGNEAIFRRLCAAMARPELADDPRFADAHSRKRNVAELDAAIGAWTGSRTLVDANEALRANDVPATPIYTMADIFADPQYAARDMLLEVPEPTLGAVTMAGIVPKLSATPGSVRWAGHAVGQDTRSVLSERLGLSDDDLERLKSDGVVWWDDAQPPASNQQGTG